MIALRKALTLLIFFVGSGLFAAGHAAQNGKKTYNTTCGNCHEYGSLRAPRIGDLDDWGPRIAQGTSTLYTHALNGHRRMPALGANSRLRDNEVRLAVDYMVGRAKH